MPVSAALSINLLGRHTFVGHRASDGPGCEPPRCARHDGARRRARSRVGRGSRVRRNSPSRTGQRRREPDPPTGRVPRPPPLTRPPRTVDAAWNRLTSSARPVRLGQRRSRLRGEVARRILRTPRVRAVPTGRRNLRRSRPGRPERCCATPWKRLRVDRCGDRCRTGPAGPARQDFHSDRSRARPWVMSQSAQWVRPRRAPTQ